VRVGIGYDVHALVPDRPLVLGGVTIPFELGLEGHSDADVVCHAIADAILGAAGLGDIGHHFPDTDPRFAGISSLEILRRVRKQLQAHGLQSRPCGSTWPMLWEPNRGLSVLRQPLQKDSVLKAEGLGLQAKRLPC